MFFRRLARLRDSQIFSYVLAIALPALGLVGQALLFPTGPAETSTPFFLLIPAVFLVSLIGGFGPGILATLLSALGVWYWFLQPEGSFEWPSLGEDLKLLLFVGLGFMFSIFNGRAKLALEREAHALRQALENESKLLVITDALPALVSYFDTHQKYRFVNATYEDWFGLKKSEVIGKHVRHVLGEAVYEKLREPISQVLAGKRVDVEILLPYRWGGSRYVHIEYVPDLNKRNEVRGAVVLVSDISERMKAEIQLRQSESRFRTLTTLAPVGIFQTDAEGNCLAVNERWCKMAGLTPDEAAGPGWVKALHPEDRERVFNEWHEATRAGREFRSEYRFITPEGVVTELRGSAVALRNETGKTTGLIGTITDITELKEAIRVRDDFMSIASHELKTPLTSLKLQTQILRHKFKAGVFSSLSEQSVMKLANGTEQQVDRLNRLVEDMLDVARIQSRKLTLEKSEVDLCSLIEQVIERFTIVAQASGATIQLECDRQIIGQWDSYRIEQVLTNLLSNAVKYGTGKPIEVSARSIGGRGVISVRDYGLGIAQKDLDKIFHKFERAIPHTRISGLGLGLYIVKQIIDAHHGTIRVESEPGQGSTFIVEIPLRDEVARHA